MARTAEYAREAGKAGRAVGSHHYQAHSLANFAWIAYQNGDGAQAIEKSGQASDYFASSSVPFAWIGYLVLLASSLATKQVEQAVEAARAMLESRQQRLPEDLTAALDKAVRSWDKGDMRNVHEYLERSVALAKEGGYL
jgi:hypothetical protein